MSPKRFSLVAAASVLVSCAKPPCADGVTPAGPGPGGAPCISRLEKADFLKLTWTKKSKVIHTAQGLRDWPQQDLSARDCAPRCMEAIAGAGPPLYEACSQACLESALPGPWLAYWKSVLPDSMRSRVKPLACGHSREMRISRDSIVIIRDTVITVCAAADTTPDWWQYQPLYYHRNRYSRQERIAFRKWRVDSDVLLLARGRKTITRQTPYQDPGQERVESSAAPDRQAPIKATPDSTGYGWDRYRSICIDLEGEKWCGFRDHLLADSPSEDPEPASP
jgi:hypothetical protein